MKTLDQVEARTPLSGPLPLTISQPGSYYLTKDLQGVAGQSGIIIAASDVNLDLNGYSLVGSSDGQSTDGILLNAGIARLRVHNGTIRQWKGRGINVTGFSTTHCRYEDLQVTGNGGSGVRAGANTTVLRCVFAENGGAGLDSGNHTLVKDSSAQGNDGHGLSVGSASVVSGCTAAGIRGALNAGIRAESSSQVSGSSARSNAGTGIFVNGSCLVTDCVTEGNAAVGIAAGAESMVKGCVVQLNAQGAKGITVSARSTVMDCRVNGFGPSTIGIHATGSRNRIEGNSVGTSGTGYLIDSTLNVIIRITRASTAELASAATPRARSRT